MGSMSGQTALITGAASGIGEAVARRFAEEGAFIVALDRDADGLGLLRDHLGNQCEIIVGDCVDAEVCERSVAMALNRSGKLDCVVANAGVYDWYKRVDRMSAADLGAAFDELFRTNVLSALLIARTSVEALRAAGGSLIVSCSNASFRAGGGGALYTASKFALRGIVYQLAHEWAPKVRVNGVAPGGTVTGLSGLDALESSSRRLNAEERIVEAVASVSPMGRVAVADDHAGCYVLLASRRDGGYLNGTILVSDGGLSSRMR
jgi:NAD(P)-dependent dehydrogenase (short-subunit alcohol dehydrogenase family)